MEERCHLSWQICLSIQKLLLHIPSVDLIIWEKETHKLQISSTFLNNLGDTLHKRNIKASTWLLEVQE